MKIEPPKRALNFLRWFCREDYLDEIEGDLIEIFEMRFQENPNKANWFFWWQVILHFRPDYFKKIQVLIFISNAVSMFKHNFVISYRSMLRYKRIFFINIFGLTTGVACTILILLWVRDEMSFDKFHKNDNQLYQVLQNFSNAQGIVTLEWTPAPLANTLVSEYPEVEKAVEVFPAGEYTINGILSLEDEYLKAKSKFVGSDFFEVFSFKLLEGSATIEPQKILISEELAFKLFREPSEAINKTVKWSQGGFEGDYLISGIFEKVPYNSSLQFDVLFSFELFKNNNPRLQSWTYNDPATYVVLNENADKNSFGEKIIDLTRKHDKNAEGNLILRKYSSQYLFNQFENGVQAGGRINYVYLFSIIAIFITLIACINFINLYSSRASNRFKEIGVKKSFGIRRSTLVFQFLSESLLLSFISAIVGVICTALLLPEFNYITGKNISLTFDVEILFYFLALIVFNGIVAGIYPALYLSNLNSLQIFKQSLVRKKSPLLLRKGLVIFQFTISLVLIIASLVVFSQLEFIQTKNLGYNQQNIVTVSAGNKEGKELTSFLTELEATPGVVSVTAMQGDLFTGNHNRTRGLSWDGKDENEQIYFTDLKVGYDFVKTLDIQLIEGRGFSKDFQNEEDKMLINKSAAEIMGLDNPVGTTVRLAGRNVEIIGVLKDFHYESFYQEVKPCLFQLNEKPTHILVKIADNNPKQTLNYVRQLDKKYNYGVPFDFNFLEQASQDLYKAEIKVSALSKYFTTIAIIISCLGLLGLSTFTAEQRSKEMGIRKVLGAPISHLVYQLSKEFVLLIVIALFIGFPIGYFISESWLESFAYRVEFTGWYLAIACTGLLLITCLTISFQTLKVAFANPVKTLRSE